MNEEALDLIDERPLALYEGAGSHRFCLCPKGAVAYYIVPIYAKEAANQNRLSTKIVLNTAPPNAHQ